MREVAVKVRLANIASKWGRMVDEAANRVVVLSPYLTSKRTFERVSTQVPLSVYTEFGLELFASGASSIRVLKYLVERENTELFWLQYLHAKIVIVDDCVLTIGSQNMTARGEKNREATAIVSDETECKAALEKIESWAQCSIPITMKMIQEMEAMLHSAMKLYREFKKSCDEGNAVFQKMFDDAVQERNKAEAERLTTQEHLIEARNRIDSAVSRIEERLNEFFPDNQVSEDIAKDFVEKSAWWLDHPTAHRDVRAPRASRYLYRSPWLGYCWTYASDSNKYMVERAIIECKKIVTLVLEDRPWETDAWGQDDLVTRIKHRLFDFVANCNDEEYPGRYRGIRNNDIKFGTNSLDMNDFARCFTLRYGGMGPLFEAINDVEMLEASLSKE